ncbi:MAG: GNAT family N-acetyltransferase [Pyrinomonadaceae bacterium]
MSNETYRTRPFEEADCAAAVRLALDLGLSPWSADDYRLEIKRDDSVMFAAANSSKLAGFIVGRIVPGAKEGSDAEIYNIGVDLHLHRSGIGGELIRRFFERCAASDVQNIWLEVRAANAKAIHFYRRFGFVEYWRRPEFYRDPPDDGVVMKLDLTDRSKF